LAERQWKLPILSGTVHDLLLVGTNDHGELLLIYGTNQDLRAALYNVTGSPIWVDKLLSNSAKYVLPNSLITNWMIDRWIFKMGEAGNSVYCIDRNGTMLWGESGKMISDMILSAMPVDDESVFVAFLNPNNIGDYVYDLYLQKLNKNGDAVWKSGGIKIFENVSVNCVILPDKNGGAYLIFDALLGYPPQN